MTKISNFITLVLAICTFGWVPILSAPTGHSPADTSRDVFRAEYTKYLHLVGELKVGKGGLQFAFATKESVEFDPESLSADMRLYQNMRVVSDSEILDSVKTGHDGPVFNPENGQKKLNKKQREKIIKNARLREKIRQQWSSTQDAFQTYKPGSSMPRAVFFQPTASGVDSSSINSFFATAEYREDLNRMVHSEEQLLDATLATDGSIGATFREALSTDGPDTESFLYTRNAPCADRDDGGPTCSETLSRAPGQGQFVVGHGKDITPGMKDGFIASVKARTGAELTTDDVSTEDVIGKGVQIMLDSDKPRANTLSVVQINAATDAKKANDKFGNTVQFSDEVQISTNGERGEKERHGMYSTRQMSCRSRGRRKRATSRRRCTSKRVSGRVTQKIRETRISMAQTRHEIREVAKSPTPDKIKDVAAKVNELASKISRQTPFVRQTYSTELEKTVSEARALVSSDSSGASNSDGELREARDHLQRSLNRAQVKTAQYSKPSDSSGSSGSGTNGDGAGGDNSGPDRSAPDPRRVTRRPNVKRRTRKPRPNSNRNNRG